MWHSEIGEEERIGEKKKYVPRNFEERRFYLEQFFRMKNDQKCY